MRASRWTNGLPTDTRRATRREVVRLAALGILAAGTKSAVAGPEGRVIWASHISLAPTWFDPAETPGLVTPFMLYYALHDGMVKAIQASIQIATRNGHTVTIMSSDFHGPYACFLPELVPLYNQTLTPAQQSIVSEVLPAQVRVSHAGRCRRMGNEESIGQHMDAPRDGPPESEVRAGIAGGGFLL